MDIKKEFKCSCGRVHRSGFDEVVSEAGALNYIVDYIKKYNGKRPFVVSDVNTYDAAGKRVCEILSDNGIDCGSYMLPHKTIEPDEKAVGSLLMHYDPSYDIIIGVGSGVINDLCKVLANAVDKPYIAVATAPSMDGYVSTTSSVVMDGVKWSIKDKSPEVVIGDIDILKAAPERMLISGLGDVVAKYISIADWRIANLVKGEYYCEEVAGMVRTALKKCVDNADKLLKREPEAVKAVFEGLVLSGAAMNYAEMTCVASGVEHSISHIWDMRGVEFGTSTDFHGIQCAVGTLYAAEIYDILRSYELDTNKAVEFAKAYNFDEYAHRLREFIGSSAEAMIEREAADKKYDTVKHGERLKNIENNWARIKEIIEEVPSAAEISRLLDMVKCPKTCEEIGIDKTDMPMTFDATKDIRDKYVLSRFCWDLGITDEIKANF